MTTVIKRIGGLNFFVTDELDYVCIYTKRTGAIASTVALNLSEVLELRNSLNEILEIANQNQIGVL